MPRYLFGPVDAIFATEYLHATRLRGECLVFGHKADPGLDLHIGPTDSWNDILARMPTGWVPDYVVLRVEYATVPFGLWSAPVPLIGLAGDANLLWTVYRRVLPRCDLVLADSPSIAALTRSGLADVWPADLYGCGRSWLEEHPEAERDIDVLFVGNLHPAVQRERQRWLGKLAALAGRWRIRIATGVFGAAYRDLMRRSRIVFNRSIRGESNQRVAETIAAGALLFQERGNSEVAKRVGEPTGCIFYDEDNFDALIDHYLEDENARKAVVELAGRWLPSLTFDSCWAMAVTRIEEALPAARLRASHRRQMTSREALLLRATQWLSTTHRDADPMLKTDLLTHLNNNQKDADLHLALGLILSVGGDVSAAANSFDCATSTSHGAPLPTLSLLIALAAMGQTQAASDGARRLLMRVEHDPTFATNGPDFGVFPALFDHFRVEWERAGFDHAGDVRRQARSRSDLLRWRLFALLANLTGNLAYRYEAVIARPDLPLSRAELGCALGRAGKPAEAVSHLRIALAGNPLDQQAARALDVGLRECIGAADPDVGAAAR